MEDSLDNKTGFLVWLDFMEFASVVARCGNQCKFLYGSYTQLLSVSRKELPVAKFQLAAPFHCTTVLNMHFFF
jgi:hypothetical protein